MREILCIEVDTRFESCVGYLGRRLEPFINPGYVSVEIDGGIFRIMYNDAVDVPRFDNEKRIIRIRAVIVDAISEVIINDCKAHFIAEQMRLPATDVLGNHAFVCALSTFDRATDKMIASGLVKLTPRFLLGSFYDFCLASLKKRWLEVCVLANENINYLMCGKNFNELIRFLIANIENTCDYVHLVRGSDGVIEMTCSDAKALNNLYVGEGLGPEICLLQKLIMLSPRRIFFVGECELFNRIRKMFVACVDVNAPLTRAGTPRH